MKNEGMIRDEWIDHYLWMGADRVYLIDNGSSDDTVAKAQAWVAKGRVALVEYPGRHQQRRHYYTAIKHFGIDLHCQWLLIADLDEFLSCPAGDTLAKALEKFDPFYDVIYANWVMFGSCGFTAQPPSVRESFTLRRAGHDSHNHTKFICQTKILKTPRTIDIHKIRGADSARTISDNFRFQLNHYPIQSEQFFRSVKMTRGDADNVVNEHVRDMNYFRRYDQGCDQPDHKLANLVAAARNR